MDILLPLLTTSELLIIIITFPIFIILLLFCLSFSDKNKRKKTLKEANILPPKLPGAWPIIGHLPLLNISHSLLHVTLGRMVDKYGPIFTIMFGVHPTLVVNDGNTAKECLTTKDHIFATRPKNLLGEIMGYNYAMFGTGPYGPYWRQSRKLVAHEFFSHKKVEILGHVRESELKKSLKDIYSSWLIKNRNCCNNSNSNSDMVMMVGQEMKQWFGSLNLNTIVRILFGKRLGSDEEGIKAIETLRQFFDCVGAFSVSDTIPYLRWLDLGGSEKRMKEGAAEIDNLIQKWLDEHKSRRNNGDKKPKNEEEEEDLMDVMISILDATSAENHYHFSADTINKAICSTLLLGSIDPLTTVMTWVLALLLNNPEEMKKVMTELDVHVGRQRNVQESDIKNLVYLQAVIKETLRLYPPAPLAFPHESLEDCTVAGYFVPKGTRLLLNIHKIQRDPNVWSAPHEFQPQRFLTSHGQKIDVKGQNFELIPFGSGRRICPGITLGLNVVHFTMASLIHSFAFAKSSDEPIDMTEAFGINNLKVTPLDVLIAPRLSAHLYDFTS